MISTSTDVSISVSSKVPADTQAIVIFIPQGARPADGATAGAVLGESAAKSAARLIEAGVSLGKPREVRFDLEDHHPHHAMRRIYLVGLGQPESITAESLRQSAAAATRALAKQHIHKATLALPTIATLKAAEVAEALVTGALLASFSFRQYKGTAAAAKDGDAAAKPLKLTLFTPRDEKAIKSAADRAKIISDAQNFARTIAGRPGNDINPPALAKVAQTLARDTGLRCTILDEKKMKSLGMGGILAVGAGSIHAPPRMIVLEHKPARPTNKKPLLVVGKAITFDTGGISIKPAEKMGKMIFDKCGGMAVLGLMCALAKLKSPVHVIGILSSAENSVSSLAYRPGDILRMFNGVTVEVTNTDAEGRLVLGDALAWGIKTYRPAAVVDLATLTGGVITALGRTMAGVMSNSDTLVAQLTAAGDSAGEKIWRLPLGEDQREQIKSDPADIVNSAGRDAHPLQGGAFLSYFVPTDKSIPWAHLDIAGVADTEKDLPLYAKGATGWGVRTLLNWVSAR